MIQYLKHEEIDFKKWNNLISTDVFSSPLVYAEALNIASPKWNALIYGNYEYVFAVPIKKKLGIIPYVWQPQFIPPVGIYGLNPEKSIIHEFKNALSQIRASKKLHSFTKFGESDLELKTQFLKNSFNRYNENTKRNIAKFENTLYEVRYTDSTDFLVDVFYKEKGNQIKNIKFSSIELLRKLCQYLVQYNFGKVVSIYNDKNELLAIALFINHNNTITYYKGAVTDIGKKNGAMHYLIDYGIRKLSDTINVFDFGGSNVDSVAKFYKGFGGEDRIYYLIK